MSDNIIKVEKMTISDFELISRELEEKFDNFWSQSILKNELLSSNREYFVIKNNGEIDGFIGVLLNDDELEIMNIVVRKSERKKSYGSILLKKVIEFAMENMYKKIYLEVNEKNICAIKLYEKFGFEKIGVRKNYYNNIDDGILYEKNI